MKRLSVLWTVGLAIVAGPGSAIAEPYERACYRANIPPGDHDAEAVATILDERTIRIDHFTYDGAAPLVYFYLGATNTYNDFFNGVSIGPVLDRAYADESLTVQLPMGETLDGYGAISVWCEAFMVNFTSASFAAPAYPRACLQADITPIFHDAQGHATILDERTILVEHFTYDGPAPLVYFYLGATESQQDLVNGIPIGPQLVRDYVDESITLELPPGQNLDGYGAISVWCAQVNVNFGSGEFPRVFWDFDIDGDVDPVDTVHFLDCMSGPSIPQTDLDCLDADGDGDMDVDMIDFAGIQRCMSGAGVLADLGCDD